MKLKAICGATALLAMMSVTAHAQSCSAPITTWHPNTAGTPSFTANTCDPGMETGIVSVCQNANQAAGHAAVFQFTPQASGTFTTITISGVSGFTAYVAVVPTSATGACNGGGDTGACVTSGDTATPLQHALIPNGVPYYLIVSNSNLDPSTACGPFTLTANGTLPVSLTNFTVS